MNALELRRRTLGKGVYKKTVEGNPAIAQGSLARRYPGITMQGWTEQAQYEGSQLFDISKITPGDIGGSNITIDGEKIIVTNGPGSSGVYPKEPNSLLQYCPNIVAGKSYTLKFDTTGTYKNIYIQGYGSWYSGQTLNITEQILSSKIAFYASGPDTSATISNFMINEGSSALTYEPYTGGQPSPNPDYPQEIVSAGKYNEGTGKYEYEVKLTGANLFDPAKLTGGEIVEYNGVQCYKYTDNSTNFTYVDDFAENTQYCFSVMILSSDGNEEKNTNIVIRYTDGTRSIIKISHNQLINLVSSANKTVAMITGNSNWSVVRYIDLTMTTLGIGTEPLPYQPYKEQTVTLTSDRPLTKWDKLEKRGGQWGWVYKSEIKKLTSSNDIRNIGAYYSTYDIQKADENLLINSLSTHFRYAQLPQNDGVFWIDINGTRLCFTRKNITNLDEIKSWLESELVVFEYPLLEETFVTLSASEQEQMNELHTFHPTTVLSNDAGCEMSLTYKTKKSLEVTT